MEKKRETEQEKSTLVFCLSIAIHAPILFVLLAPRVTWLATSQSWAGEKGAIFLNCLQTFLYALWYTTIANPGLSK